MRIRSLFAAALLVALLAAPAAGAQRAKAPQVALAADPAALLTYALPCAGTRMDVRIRSLEPGAIYTDVTVEPQTPVQVSRRVISSWLPAGYELRVPVTVSATTGGATGERTIVLRSGRARAVVPVTVEAAPDSDNLALYRGATASSSTGGYPPCGAVDGNRNSNDWGTLTGWNDGTSGVFPDTLDVRFEQPRTVGRVDLYTLDSARYPAARYGLRDWDVQVLAGGGWTTVAEVRGNTSGLVSSTFAPVRAEAIRVIARGAADGYSRIVELEAYAG